MRSRKGRATILAAMTAVTLSAISFSPLASPAGAVPVLPSTCKATLLKVSLGGTTLLDPLVVENPPGQNCTTQGKTLLAPIVIPNILSVQTGFVKTSVKGMTSPPERPFHFPKAHARVEQLSVGLALPLPPPLNGLTVTAEAIEAKSKSRCNNGQPETVPGGKIVGLSINGGAPLNVITDPFSISIPFILDLKLNATQSSATNQQRTAVELSVPLIGLKVVIAQTATALVGSNPCLPA